MTDSLPSKPSSSMALRLLSTLTVFLALGVPGIETDRPDVLNSVLQAS